MVINKSISSSEIANIISTDIDSNKKYVGNGYKIGGTVDGNRIKLFLNDSHNKHSNFMSMNFYGNITDSDEGSYIKGSFRLATYVIVLLSVLGLLCIESVVVNLFFVGSIVDIVMPVVIFCLEIIYICYVYRTSKNTNVIITEYLNNI